MHVEVDPPAHALEDEIGLKLLARTRTGAAAGIWTRQFTRPFRASIVAHTRFIEDLIVEHTARGLIPGAKGLTLEERGSPRDLRKPPDSRITWSTIL